MQTSKWPNRWESPEAKADRIGEGVAWAALCVASILQEPFSRNSISED